MGLSFDQAKSYLRYKKDGLPSLFKNASELGQLLLSQGELKNLPDGDGHPVLVLPGFTSNDISTLPLRRLISDKGYKAYALDDGFNFGMTERKAFSLAARLKEVYEQNGNKKVTLIGHSLGGFYARALAQEYPEMVRAVVTVNTPFGIAHFPDQTPPVVVSMIENLSHERFSLKQVGDRLLTPPAGVPTTSIFSKIDNVAGWKACLNPETPLSENVEVAATHVGAVWNKDTVAIILDRLAQKEGQWKPHAKATKESSPHHPNWKPQASNWKFFPKF